MSKLFKALFVLLFFTVIFAGCVKQQTAPLPGYRIAKQIDIYCRQENFVIHRHYTDSNKMEAVLAYLRLLKPIGKPAVDPNSAEGDLYEITVTLLDGRKNTYLQKAHRYFSKDAVNWKNIDSRKAAELYRLMQYLPSD